MKAFKSLLTEDKLKEIDLLKTAGQSRVAREEREKEEGERKHGKKREKKEKNSTILLGTG